MMQNDKLFGEEWRATNPTLCFICQLSLDLLLTDNENQILGKLDPQRLKVCPQKGEGKHRGKKTKNSPPKWFQQFHPKKRYQNLTLLGEILIYFVVAKKTKKKHHSLPCEILIFFV